MKNDDSRKKFGYKYFYSLINFFKDNFYLVILTVIAAGLRLYNLKSTISFLGDQGRDSSIARDIILKLHPTLVGPTTSVGKIQLGPLYYYFMTPWLALFKFDPVGPAVGVAILGIITIPVLFFVVRKMFGQSTAYISTILYVFGSIIILNSRSSWNPNPMPLVVILLIWSLYESYKNSRYKFLIGTWFFWGLALQLHYMVLLLGPVLVIIWSLVFFSSKEKNMVIKYWLIGLFSFILLALPLIFFDLRHDFLNTKGFLEFFQKGHHSPTSLYLSLKNMEGRMYQSLGGLLGFKINSMLRNFGSWVIISSFLLLIFKNWKQKTLQIIFIYCFVSFIGLSLYTGDVFDHYIGFLFPLPFIILGVILDWIWQKKQIIPRIAVASIIFLIIVINIREYSFFKPLGWQIDDIKKVSQIIAEDAGTKTYNVVLLDDTKDYRAMNYRYFLEMANARISDVSNYNDIEVLYLISLHEQSQIANLETREIETFLGKRMSGFKDQADYLLLAQTTKKQWYFPGGPWVYRLEK